MRAMPKFRKAIIALLIAAFLTTRLMGLHLHLCFDGTEPPVSLQWQTNDVADAADNLQQADFQSANPVTMEDVDIDLLGNVLPELAKLALDLVVLPVVFSLLLLARRPSVPQPQLADLLPVPFARPRIRPPLRAPPR